MAATTHRHGPGATLIPDDLAWLIAFLRSQGSLSPLIPPATPLEVVGPATVNLTNAQRWVLCDSTAGPITLVFPVPVAPSLWLVDDWKGQSAVNPITLRAPALWTLTNPSNPGNLVSTGVIASQGAAIQWISYATRNQFVEVV